MDQGIHENQGSVGHSGQVSQGKDDAVSGKTSGFDNRVELRTLSMRELSSGDAVNTQGETEILDVHTRGFGLGRRMVNPEICGGQGIVESSNQGNSGNSSDLVHGIVCERVILINSGETSSVNQRNKDLEPRANEMGLTSGGNNLEVPNKLGNDEVLDQVEQGSNRKPTDSIDTVVLETVIIIDSEGNTSNNGDNGSVEVKGGKLGSGQAITDKSKAKIPQGDKPSCGIDMKGGGGIGGFKDVWDGDRVCRICHLSSEGSLETTTTANGVIPVDLIHLGCGCKDELGIVHSHCAEAWFKLRGNRTCEICGEMAKNVTGIVDSRLMQEWSERRIMGISSSSSDRSRGYWRGQPFCNFLMACLVIAFVLPWFFRVNLF